MTHLGAGGEGSGKASWSETQKGVSKEDARGLKPSCVCHRGQHFRQREEFKKDLRGEM